ncbi:uncharacterized protein LOC124454462 [Xenia sp. Carnegie-2017]|uniref:uncharacterized protein LOC124454462 n=1 Tax=Xenia sp. Carnegie-2017 TaxID=2897299 RepID=UPI001F0444D3|nr:uncharacterized protein LOC124454462 [Xenia sp. Carnegie-2017]
MDRFRLWSARHDNQQVDLAFVVDCTGSMGSYIRETQRNINFIAEKISKTSFSVHLALVEYRDHPPEDRSFVSRFHDFTHDVAQMKEWVNQMSANGGGDFPEAVTSGLYDAANLSYRDRATKICIWIGDAPPHGLHPDGDHFPHGDPDGRDPVQICHEMARKGIILYCVGCEPSLAPYRDFFMALSHITGGQYIRLRRARLLAQVIVNLAQEEVENENLMGHVEDHIQLELASIPDATVAQLTESLHTAMSLNNNRTRQVRLNGREIERVTQLARQMSYMTLLPQLAEAIRPQLHVHGRSDEDEPITTVDITSLDVVPEWTCERFVRRSLARSNLPARRGEDVEMEANNG